MSGIRHNLSKLHFAENEVQAAGRAGAEGESAADPIADWSKENHNPKAEEQLMFNVFCMTLWYFMLF